MRTKSTATPLSLFARDSHSAIFTFYLKALQLKNLYRQGWLLPDRNVEPAHCESVADHSWGVVLLCMLIRDHYFPKADLARLVTMAAVHDLGEHAPNVGDITPDMRVPRAQKIARERIAMECICQEIERGEWYLAVWDEYVAGETLTARIVANADVLERTTQAIVFHRAHGTPIDDFLSGARTGITLPELYPLLDEIITAA